MTVEGISVFSGLILRVEIVDDKIVRVDGKTAAVGDLPYLAPGFIDMQVNGYGGLDYSSQTFDEGQVEALIEMLAASGTTKHLPTIITAPKEVIIRNLSRLAKACRNSRRTAAALPGYHIEGPFISPEDGPRGAHNPAHVRDADYEEFRSWQEAADGRIKVVTVAPEIPGALGFIERVSRDGVIVSIGHTGASPETIHEAVEAGAEMSTHLGNGSHSMIPRLKNHLWEQLATDELVAGIITDGFHLPKAVVRTFARAKGLERLVLVSDVAVHGGAKPGIYPWGDIMVEVFPDGHLGLYKTDFLAGAGHLLDRDVAQFLRFTGCDLSEAVRLCTINPARLLGLPDAEDFCTEGATADLVLFNYQPRSEQLEICKTVLTGQLRFERGNSRRC